MFSFLRFFTFKSPIPLGGQFTSDNHSVEICKSLNYVNRPKGPSSFLFPSQEKKYTMSKELTDYIQKSNKESIERIVMRHQNFTGLLPSVLSEKSSLNSFFSLPVVYENGCGYVKNYFLYLGLFTGSFLFVLWKRQK